MRIGIDANLLLGRRRGGAQYVYNLIKNLPRIDRENSYVLFYNFLSAPEWADEISSEFRYPNVENRVFRIPSRILNFLWRGLRVPYMDAALRGIDVFHSPFCTELMPLTRCAWVATVHQVTPKKYRAFEEGWKGRERFYGMLRELSRRASIVITPSAFTRGSLAEECGFPRERMRVIAHAAADVFRPIDDKAGIEDRKKMYRTGDKYILYAGGANWNKNLVRLIDAFDRIKQERKIPHRLIITGDRSWGYSEIMAEARRKGSGDDIIFTGYVPDADLACLYNGAEFFVYPSLLEGFGFSAVEAMACGCPIAASRIPVFEEVIQDAGVFFDPEDMEEMASAMVRMIEDEHLRCELRAKGLVRARCYTWEESAKLTLKAYKDAKAFFVNDNYIRK